MRKLLRNFYHKVETTNDPSSIEEWKDILKKKIKTVCQESKNYLGTQTTAEIFEN